MSRVKENQVKKGLVIGLVLFLGLTSALSADQHLNQSRGFDARGTYQVGEVDAINLFNGALTVTLPLGPRYSLPGGLDYGFTLVYNSNLWTHREVCPFHEDTGPPVWSSSWLNAQCEDQGSYYQRCTLENFIAPTYSAPADDFAPRNDPYCADLAIPNAESNAGLGWQLTLGALYQGRQGEEDFWPKAMENGAWTYVGPDGAEHVFDQAFNANDQNSLTVNYTRDSSYLRLRLGTTDCKSPGGGTCNLIEFPGGVVEEYRNLGNPTQPDWRMVMRRNRFADSSGQPSSWVKVAYGATSWSVTDSLGRSHSVEILSSGTELGPIVSALDLAAFAGQRLRFELDYTFSLVDRGAPHAFESDDAFPGVHFEPSIPLHFLASVRAEDGSGALLSEWRMLSYDFETWPRLPGVLTRVALPTGAELEWEYGGGYIFPHGSGGRRGARGTTGVRRKTRFVPGGQNLTWTYTPHLERLASTDGCSYHPTTFTFFERCHEKILRQTVTEPSGLVTEHRFSVYPFLAEVTEPENGATPVGWDMRDYGLAIDRAESIAAGGGERLFLSRIVRNAEGHVLRKVYQRYDSDTPDLPDGSGIETRVNPRLATERVVYFERQNNQDEEVGWRQSKNTNWDRLGHFRQTTTSGNLPGSSAAPRTTFTNYNPAPQTVPPGIDAPWVLNTYTEQTVTEGGSTQKMEACFDPATGFLRRTRALAGTSRSSRDVVRHFEANDLGQVAWETLRGGSTSPVSTGDLCGLSLPTSSAVVRTNHTYSHGVLAKSVAVEPCSGTEVLVLADRTIDPNTGLPSSERDSAGLATTLTYDALGRTTSIRPPGEVASEITYRLKSAGAANNEVDVERGTGTQRTRRLTQFDALGRPTSESIDFPAVGADPRQPAARREWLYDAAGRVSGESTWQCGNNALECQPSGPTVTALVGVTRSFFDDLSRVTKVVPPDSVSGSKDVTLAYEGDWKVTRTANVTQTLGGAPSAVPRVETRDVHGRLVAVAERSGPGGSDVTTKYTYDVGNRLTRVSTTSAGVTQQREFRFDGRGFLTAERHPEIGVSGNAWVRHGDHDARGNPLWRGIAEPSGATPVDQLVLTAQHLTMRYDAAGRKLETLHEGQPLEQWFYSRSNSGGNFSKGKLIEAKRWNPGGRPVTETYTYAGVGGRMSQRETKTGDGYRFTQSFTFDTLGQLTSETYPTCEGPAGPCGAGGGPSRTVSYGYHTGLLKAVSDGERQYLTDTLYAPNGRVALWSHGNGVAEKQVNDSNGLGRAGSITVTPVSGTGWTTGAYQFDGAGNLIAMGPDQFAYDGVSRLVNSRVSGATQTLSFDAFGNIQTHEVTGAEAPPEVPVDDATNRLEGVAYSPAGNVHSFGGSSYWWDELNAMVEKIEGGVATRYAYAPGGERLSATTTAGVTRWTLRGLGNQVIRQLEQDAAGTWTWQRDYIHAGRLLASVAPGNEGLRHYHLDHLGSTRAVSNAAGTILARHTYLPFGQEISDPAQSGSALKFTGHERDEGASAVSRADDLDYMHARYCSPAVGRFLGIDPVVGRVEVPQSWNRYAYVRGNPMGFVDPDGQEPVTIGLIALGAVEVAFTAYDAYDATKTVLDPHESGFLKTVTVAGAVAGVFGAAGGYGRLGRFLAAQAEKYPWVARLLRRGDEASDALNNSLPSSESQLRHIFRDAPGHLPDTPANRTLLLEVAGDSTATLGTDTFGNVWSSRTLEDGTQVWVQVRNGVIQNGGVNPTPRVFGTDKGLSGGS